MTVFKAVSRTVEDLCLVSINTLWFIGFHNTSLPTATLKLHNAGTT